MAAEVGLWRSRKPLSSTPRHLSRDGLARSWRIPATQVLAEKRRAASSVRHPDEQECARWLLTEFDRSVPMITRPRGGCCWGSIGTALRLCGDRPGPIASPIVLNNSWDCFDLRSAFPEFAAVGRRGMQPEFVNRVVFEFRTEPTAQRHIAQVGIARLSLSDTEGPPSMHLAEDTKLVASVTYSSAGDLQCSCSNLEVLSPGSNLSPLTPRLGDWCSGGPTWLLGSSTVYRIMMEVDLIRGVLTVSLDDWSQDPMVVKVPGLLEVMGASPWLPFATLTATGHEVRILDFHVRTEK